MTSVDAHELLAAVKRYGAACRMYGRAAREENGERMNQATKAEMVAWQEVCRITYSLTDYDPLDVA